MNTADKIIEENALLKQQVLSQQQRISLLEELLHTLRHRQFSPSSETQSAQQPLFDEAESVMDEADESENLAQAADDASSKVSSKGKRKPRVTIPENIEREIIIHDLSEQEKTCPHDGTPLHCIGEETHEQLDIIPAQIKAVRHIRKKYACSCCETYVVTASKPKQAIEKSIASAGLLAHVATAKYADALPLYRQSDMFTRLGIHLDRTNLANWMIKCGDLTQPLINRLHDLLCEQKIIHMDETPLQVLKEPDKPAQSQSYMWLMCSSRHSLLQARLFYYSPSRSQSTPNMLLNDYEHTLMADGYAGYQPICSQNNIVRLGCWAHARRKFIEAQIAQGKKKTGRADQAIAFIQKLYRIEKAAKELSSHERLCLRQHQSREVIDKLYDWLQKSLPQAPPKTAIGKAFTYLNNQWSHLIRYLDDGDYPIDNNPAENAIRPFVIGRKNWLFANSQAGAHASANLYSLIETAKANDLNPYEYLRKIFTDLPKADLLEDIDKLLPWSDSVKETCAINNKLS